MGVFTGMYAFLYWVASEGRHDDSQHNLSCCANRFFIMVLFPNTPCTTNKKLSGNSDAYSKSVLFSSTVYP